MAGSSHQGAALHGSYAITGGLGGLGMRAARLLVEGGVSTALLVSRSGLVARDDGRDAGERAVLHGGLLRRDC